MIEIVKKKFYIQRLRACNNGDSITSNNTYLNIIEILFYFNFFQIKEHPNRKFTSDIDLRKHDFYTTKKSPIQ